MQLHLYKISPINYIYYNKVNSIHILLQQWIYLIQNIKELEFSMFQTLYFDNLWYFKICILLDLKSKLYILKI